MRITGIDKRSGEKSTSPQNETHAQLEEGDNEGQNKKRTVRAELKTKLIVEYSEGRLQSVSKGPNRRMGENKR